MLEGLNQIVDFLSARARSAWSLGAGKVYIGEDKAEKSGPNTRYAAIVWENVEADHYPAFIEFMVRPLYVVYVGPPPPGKRGEAAKTQLFADFLDRFEPPENIQLEQVGMRYDEDWDVPKAAVVSLVIEFSATWHEKRTRVHSLGGSASIRTSGAPLLIP